jgi:hypothetical protein
MPIVTRNEAYPDRVEDVTLVCILGPKETYPDVVLQRFARGYTPYFEAYTPNSGGSRTEWKNFEHYKSTQGSPPSGGSAVLAEVVGFWPPAYSIGQSTDPFVGYVSNSQFAYSLPYGDPGVLDQDLPPLYSPDGAGHFVAAPSALPELENRAIMALLPLIKSELSIPNFIYELKDFRSTITALVRIYKSPSFIAAVKWLATPKEWSFKHLMSTSAGNYLNLQFNWLSLISDIGKIYLAIKRTHSRLNDYVSRVGRVQVKHFHFGWTEYPDSTNPWAWGNRVGSQIQWGISQTGSSRQVSYDTSIFHAEVQYNYNYLGYQIAHAQLLSMMDLLGLNLNPAIIWNAMPWTFVLDWVVGIGPYLDSLKETNMEPLINIRRYLWSVKRKRRITVTTEIRNAYDTSTLHRITLPVVTQTAYRRQVAAFPTSSIESSGLTLKEVSLGAALVIARKR